MVADIPSHPPYAFMISKAIRTLKEERGAMESSISEYIKANFEGLPRAHDRFLTYYLDKLTAQAEFVRVPDGRFLIAGDDGDYEAAGAEKGTKATNADYMNSQSLATLEETNVDDEDKNGGVQNKWLEDTADVAARSWHEEITKGCGQDGPTVADVESLRTLHCHQKKPVDVDGAENDLSLMPKSEPTIEGKDDEIESRSAPKGRGSGRPPKRKGMSVDGSERAMAHHEDVKSVNPCSLLGTNGNAAEPAINKGGDALGKEEQDDESKQVPRRRGRPPKREHESADSSTDALMHYVYGYPPKTRRQLKIISLETESGDGNVLAMVQPQLTGPKVEFPKLRGRPPKSKPVKGGGHAVATGKHKDGSKMVPKRCGWQPKRTHESTTRKGDGAPRMKRRKLKGNSNQDAYIELLKTETGDGDGSPPGRAVPYC